MLGCLNLQELYEFSGTINGPCQLTKLACMRILDITYLNKSFYELDFIDFINLILIIENKSSKSSINYLFQLLDIYSNNYINSNIIKYFYSNISYLLHTNSMQNISMDVICNEIYDMLGCNNDTSNISYEEFINSGNGRTVGWLLLDIESFMNYEQRESQVNQLLTT